MAASIAQSSASALESYTKLALAQFIDVFKGVWSKKSKKWINTSRNADERLYWDMVYVGNGMKDIDDYRDVIKIPSWRHESCCVFEDVLSEMKKALLYELYKEEKEKKNMGEEDNKPTRNSEKRVRFA